MAVLSNAARGEQIADWHRTNTEPVGMTKAQMRAALDAIDDWLNSNATSLNNAIPQPQRGALTTAQKARLLMLVVQRRYLDGA